jgi:hypothetical protein
MTTVIRITSCGDARYRAEADGQELCVSTTPFCSGARRLLDLGYSADEPIVLRHEGSETDCLVSTIGVAAGPGVNERTGREMPAAVLCMEAERICRQCCFDRR